MPRNGSGVYSLPAGNPVVTGTTIASTWANPTMDDFVTQFNNVLTADGLLPATAPIKFFAGTATAPGITFNGDTDTGWYNFGANQIGLTLGGNAMYSAFHNTTGSPALWWSMANGAAAAKGMGLLIKGGTGDSSGVQAGGAVQFNGGSGGTGGGAGGAASVVGGLGAAAGGVGGTATVQGGQGQGAGATGGAAYLQGGASVAANGGIAVVQGGNAVGGTGDGGDVRLSPGSTVGGSDGKVDFAARSNTANGTDAVTITALRPAAAATATIAGWLTVKIGGVTSYIPYWR